MSDATHSPEHTTIVEENTDPLPIPPRTTPSNAPSSSVRTPEQDIAIQERIAGLLRICEDGSTNIAGIRFPHPDEPASESHNDSDQENIPPTPTVSRPDPPVQTPTPLGRTRHSIPFTDDVTTNQALLATITRVRNNVDHSDAYVEQIEEIVRIGRALRHRGSPSEDDEAAALVARLHQIRRLESGSESSSTSSPTSANVTFPTPSVPSYAQVVARTSTPGPRVHAMARGPAPAQQRTSRGQRGAGSQARRMGGRVPTILTGVHDGAELLPPSASRRIETPPPIGFHYNRGPNYVPFVITNNSGRAIPVRFTRVVMGADPHVIGMVPGDNNQYGGPLHAAPDHDLGERPRYAPDNLWQFKSGADNAARVNLALDFIHNLSLTAEVARFRETSRLFAQYQEDIRKIEVRMWEAGQMKDSSARRLEGANALHRIEEALVEINRRQQRRQPLTERGRST